MYQGYRLTSARRFLVAKVKIQDWHWKYFKNKLMHKSTRRPSVCLVILTPSLRLNHVQKVELTWAESHWYALKYRLVLLCWSQTVLQWVWHDAAQITCVAPLEIHFNSAEYSLRFPHFPFFGAYRDSQMLLHGEQLKRNIKMNCTSAYRDV